MDIHDQKQRLSVKNSDISGSLFDDVNASGATLHNMNMSGWHVDYVNLAGLRLTKANLAGASLVRGCVTIGLMVRLAGFAGVPSATSSTLTRCRTLKIIPRVAGVSSRTTILFNFPKPSERTVAF